ncbi:Uncharacterized protein SCF082_LOCUS28751 [Durusdinium trenchii]|uniref:RNA-editing substrate-binding complex 6 protein domain-containing protein n=1 Tax=Durusdinium trenchii TaxID=1381693 RepID=A0ABP0MM67_9DINO
MEARKLVSGRLGAQLLRCGKQQGRPKFTATTAPPAHLVYDQLPDKATLLLVAQSAASSNYKDQVFWQNCSSQARRLCQDDLHALACYAATAASAQHQDDELLYNVGDMAVAAAENNMLEPGSLALVLQSHAILAFRNDRVVGRMESELFEMLRQSKATAACLATSLLSLSQLFSASALPDRSERCERSELIDGGARVALEHLSFFTVAQLCNLLQAMANFRIRGDRQVSALLLGISNSLARQTSELSSKDCGTIAKTFAVCRVHDERILTALASRLREKDVRTLLTAEELSSVLYGFAKFTSQDIALLDLLSIEVRRHLHALDATLMSSMLASLAKAGVSCPVLTGRATQILRRTLPGNESAVSHRVSHPCNLQLATFSELSALTMAFAKFQVRDSRLHERLAQAFLECNDSIQPIKALEVQSCPELINVVHAFAKVHIAPVKLFGAVMGLLLSRPPEELSTRDAVKFLHALAKVEYTILPQMKGHILAALSPHRLNELGVFELLKLAVAARKLGLDLPQLEAQVSAILPNEPSLQSQSGNPQRRPVSKRRRRKSARKQKWSW